MKPLLLRSALTDRLYITTSYTRRGEVIVASRKCEVTDSELAAAFLVSIPVENRDDDEFEIVVKRSTVHP